MRTCILWLTFQNEVPHFFDLGLTHNSQKASFHFNRHNKLYYSLTSKKPLLRYKQKIEVIWCNQVYFSSSNVSTYTTVIVKD